MLVLSRKKNESIMIGDDVKLVIVDVRGDKVRVGIEAPEEVPVHRREVWLAKQREAGGEEPASTNPPEPRPSASATVTTENTEDTESHVPTASE